jgi:hypothetical protein
MKTTRSTPTVVLSTALTALLALALTPGCEAPKKPTPSHTPRKTMGEKTQNVGKLSEELQKGGVLAETTIPVSDPLTQSAAAYRTSVAKIGAMSVEQAIQIRNAQNIMEDPKPLTYDEFMTEIIKKGQPDGIQLPMLPYYQEYAWDEQNQKLVVVEYPKRKEEFEASQPGPR